LEIAECLAAQRNCGVKLKGIIYLHHIKDDWFQGSDVKSLKILEEMCGKEAFSNVALVTNMWHCIDEATGEGREDELRRNYWGTLIGGGAIVRRFDGTASSARQHQLVTN
jgi:hypothetical protein